MPADLTPLESQLPPLQACLPLVEDLLGGKGEDDLKRSAHLMWSEYEVPDDCAGWLYSFASVAETVPACIVISDSTIPGNPMVYVNHEFCNTTGYSKNEAQGRKYSGAARTHAAASTRARLPLTRLSSTPNAAAAASCRARSPSRRAWR